MQRETIVEALARDKCKRSAFCPYLRGCAIGPCDPSFRDEAEADIAALEALGLAVLPREPTEGMVEGALHMKTPAYDGAPANYARNLIANTYRAMLAAAPLPAAPNQGDG